MITKEQIDEVVECMQSRLLLDKRIEQIACSCGLGDWYSTRWHLLEVTDFVQVADVLDARSRVKVRVHSATFVECSLVYRALTIFCLVRRTEALKYDFIATD